MEFRIAPTTIARTRRSYLTWALVITLFWALLCVAFAPVAGRPPVDRVLNYGMFLVAMLVYLWFRYRAIEATLREQRLSIEGGHVLISFRDNQTKSPLEELKKIVLYGPKGKTNYIKLVRPRSMKVLISGFENMEDIVSLIAGQYPNVPTTRWRWRAF